MIIAANILQQAIEVYLRIAYPGDAPATALAAAAGIRALAGDCPVPLELLEKGPGDPPCGYALRLGQPRYQFMKLAIDAAPQVQHPTSAPSQIENQKSKTDRPGAPVIENPPFLLRVDAHDKHLHAPPGSPDAAWLASVRASNLELGQKIEAAWGQAGLPTFKEFLRKQLELRKAKHGM